MFPRNVYQKALFRQPIRFLILLFLLAAACFAFTSHAAEALLVAQETAIMEEYYKPVGSLSGGADLQAGQEIVATCPYVEVEDIRRYGRGILMDIENPDVDGEYPVFFLSSHIGEVVFVGRFLKGEFVTPVEGMPHIGDGGYYNLRFEVRSVESGYQDYMEEGEEVFVRSLPGLRELPDFASPYYPSEQNEDFLKEYGNLEEGVDYLIRVFYYHYNEINGHAVAREGKPGKNFVLDSLIPGEETGFFYKMTGESIDYSTPELSVLPDYMEYLSRNRHAMSVIGTKDMERMPKFQESSQELYLVEGRMLNREDDLEGKQTCVVHEEFAKLRGLQVGDVLRLSLDEIYRNGDYLTTTYIDLPYVGWENWGAWRDCGTEELELEIVGLYNQYMSYNSSYASISGTILYVPDSILPEGYARNILAGGGTGCYSFILKKPEEQVKFLEEYGSRLEQAGYTAVFLENNVENFSGTADTLRRSTVFGTAMFGAVLAIAVLVAISLYLIQRRKEYAVSRALGVPAGRTILGITFSFGWIAVPGVIAGSCLGWWQMLRQAEEVLAPLLGETISEGVMQQVETRAILPGRWLALVILAILLVLFLFLFVGSSFLTRKPVLSLLQGSAGRTGAKEGKETTGSIKPGTRDGEKEREQPSSGQKQQGELGQMAVSGQRGIHQKRSRGSRIAARLCYAGKHALRARIGLILPLILGTGLALLFGWMSRTVDSYADEVERLYNTTVIKAEIRPTSSLVMVDGQDGQNEEGIIRPALAEAVERSGLVQKTYREEVAGADMIYVEDSETGDTREIEDIRLLGLYDWEIFTKEKDGSHMEFSFVPGYDGEFFLRERPEESTDTYEVVLSADMIEGLGLKLGDSIMLENKIGKKKDAITCTIVGSYQYIIDISGQGKGNVILHADTLHALAGKGCYCRTVQFTFEPTKNRELLEREEELKEIISKDKDGSFLRLFIWDEELQKVVEPMERTLSLFALLYPIAAVVSAALGLGFQFLLLLQRRKEAATMRMLGNPIHSIGTLMGMEQLVICVLGVAIGALLGWLSYSGLAREILVAEGLYGIGSLVGILIGAMVVAGRNPLTLLQEKE